MCLLLLGLLGLGLAHAAATCAPPPRRPVHSFWGARVRGGQDSTPTPPPPPPLTPAHPVNASGVAGPGLLVAPAQRREEAPRPANANPNPNAIPPVELTEEERALLAAVAAVETVDDVLGLVAKLPAVRACPDFHLRIDKAGPGDASVAAAALRRLGKLTAGAGRSEAERAAVRARVVGDRRLEQLLECVQCQVGALGPAEASCALFGLAALRVGEEGDELLGGLLASAAAAMEEDRWPGLQPSEAVTLAVALSNVVAFLPPRPPSQLLPLLEALEGRLTSDAPLLSAHDISRLAGALAAMGRGSQGAGPARSQTRQKRQRQQVLNHGPLLRLMGEIVRRHPQSFPPRDLAVVADALASLGYVNATVRAGVAAACAGRIAVRAS